MKNTKYFLASVLSLIAVIGLRAVGMSDYYSIDNISMPKGLDSQVGGLDFMPDGRLVACFHRGEVYTYHPQKMNGIYLRMACRSHWVSVL